MGAVLALARAAGTELPTAQGTFLAGNVLGLQAGGVMDRVAIGIDKIERNTRPIRDAEGLAFE